MMNKTFISCWAECKKFSYSKVPLITMFAALIIPFVGGFFMLILKDPEMARRMGFISAKAQIAGTADWPSYLSLLAQAVSVGGLMIFGFVASWVFGREYSDRTIKDLLALPISRNSIVMSKFIVVFIWCMMLSVFVFVLGLIVGDAVDIPGCSYETLFQGLKVFVACSLLTIFLSTPVALFASVGKGYLPPLGFMIFTLVLAQVVAAAGYGHLFPWSIPAIASGVSGSEAAVLDSVSIIIVFITSIFGLAGTVFWWRYADQY
jgi:ABC-2 type transport system permease protein